MASTGEVAVSTTIHRAYIRLVGDRAAARPKAFISIGGANGKKKIPLLRQLEEAGWEISATEGTQALLAQNGIGSRCVYKASEKLEPNVVSAIAEQQVDLVINIPNHQKSATLTDGFTIRRLAVDHHVPLITNAQIAEIFLKCLTTLDRDDIPVISWKEYLT